MPDLNSLYGLKPKTPSNPSSTDLLPDEKEYVDAFGSLPTDDNEYENLFGRKRAIKNANVLKIKDEPKHEDSNSALPIYDFTKPYTTPSPDKVSPVLSENEPAKPENFKSPVSNEPLTVGSIPKPSMFRTVMDKPLTDEEQLADINARGTKSFEDVDKKARLENNIREAKIKPLLEDIDNQQANLETLYKGLSTKSNPIVGSGYSGTPAINESFPERNKLDAANMFLIDAKKSLQSDKTQKMDAGTWSVPFITNTLSLGFNNLLNTTQLLPIKNKLDKGEALDNYETALVQAAMTKNIAETIPDKSIAYSMVNAIPENLVFMLQMIATDGVAPGVKKGVTMLAEKAGKSIEGRIATSLTGKMANGVLSKIASKGIGATGSIAADVARTPLFTSTYQSIVDRTLGKVREDGNGGYKFDGEPITPGGISEDFFNNFMELYSERFGEPISKGVKWLGSQTIGKAGGIIGKMFKEVPQGELTTMYKKLAGKAKFYGFAGELGSEYGGDLVTGIVGTSDLNQFFDSNYHKQMLTSVLGMSLGFGAVSQTGKGFDYYNYRKSEKEFNNISPNLRSQIDQALSLPTLNERWDALGKVNMMGVKSEKAKSVVMNYIMSKTAKDMHDGFESESLAEATKPLVNNETGLIQPATLRNTVDENGEPKKIYVTQTSDEGLSYAYDPEQSKVVPVATKELNHDEPIHPQEFVSIAQQEKQANDEAAQVQSIPQFEPGQPIKYIYPTGQLGEYTISEIQPDGTIYADSENGSIEIKPDQYGNIQQEKQPVNNPQVANNATQAQLEQVNTPTIEPASSVAEPVATNEPVKQESKVYPWNVGKEGDNMTSVKNPDGSHTFNFVSANEEEANKMAERIQKHAKKFDVKVIEVPNEANEDQPLHGIIATPKTVQGTVGNSVITGNEQVKPNTEENGSETKTEKQAGETGLQVETNTENKVPANQNGSVENAGTSKKRSVPVGFPKGMEHVLTFEPRTPEEYVLQHIARGDKFNSDQVKRELGNNGVKENRLNFLVKKGGVGLDTFWEGTPWADKWGSSNEGTDLIIQTIRDNNSVSKAANRLNGFVNPKEEQINPELLDSFSDDLIKEEGLAELESVITEGDDSFWLDLANNPTEIINFEDYDAGIEGQSNNSTIANSEGNLDQTGNTDGRGVENSVRQSDGKEEGNGRPKEGLTDTQQAELDKKLKSIDEDIKAKNEALSKAKQRKQKELSKLNQRNGLFGDTTEPTNGVNKDLLGDFVFSPETVKKAVEPIDAEIVEHEKGIERLKQLRQGTIDNAGKQQEIQLESKKLEIAHEENKVDTNPTDAQKEAGNYQMGHVSIQGLDITIENPKGSTRTGVDQDGNNWESTLNHTYGYIRRTEGKDGDHIDVFIGENPLSEKVFVVDQINPKDGKFDEHKTMLGFNSEKEAKEAYLSNYQEGWKGLGAVTEMPIDEFKTWLKDHTETKRPVDSVQKLGEILNPVIENSFNPKPEDVSYQRAYDAYRGISFDPEKRAKQAQDSYMESMNSFKEELYQYAKSEDQKKIANEQLIKYKEGYLNKNNAWLSAKSRVLSPMITGPARFNTSRNEKANNTEHKRLEEFIEWDKKFQANAIKAVKGGATQEEKNNAVWQSIKSTIDDKLETIIEIDKGQNTYTSRQLIVSNLTGFIKRMYKNGQYDHVVKAIDHIQDVQSKLEKPILAKNNSLWNLRDESKLKQTEIKENKDSGAGIKAVYQEGKHTKTGALLHTVKLPEKIDGNTFKQVNDAAKSNDGYYSSYVKGFIFKTKEGADSFINEIGPKGEDEVMLKKADPFYSNSERALSSISQEKGTPDQFKAMLLKNGAKQDELDWMDWDSFTKDKKSITKEDVQNWIDENKVEVKEVVKGEITSVTKDDVLNVRFKDFGSGSWVIEFKDTDLGSIEISSNEAESEEDAIKEALDRANYDNSGKVEQKTKYSQYTIPGGKNYKEVLLTLPVVKRSMSFDAYLKSYRERFPNSDSTDNEVKGYYNRGINVPDSGRLTTKSEGFMSSHFEEPNIAVHVRMNEFTTKDGKRALNLEEVQSDFSQSLKKKRDQYMDLLKNNPDKLIDMYKKSNKLEVLC